MYRTEPTRHISLGYGIHHFKRSLQEQAVTCVLTDKKSKQEEADEGSNKHSHPTSVCQEIGAGMNEEQTAGMNCLSLNVECDQC